MSKIHWNDKELRNLRLELVEATGVVVSTHQFNFESEKGTRLFLTIGEHQYMLKYTGELIEKV